MFVGVDIGGTKTAIISADNPPQVLSRIEFPTLPESGPQHALEKICAGIREIAERRGDLKAIGVSCGGPLDRHSGIIQAPPNLMTWIDVRIKNMLEAEFNVPCRVENDANAGAIAEHRYGAGQGSRHMIFLTMGTGLGAGIILNGALCHGASDMAGEIGHVRLTPDGPLGHSKAGSVEGWASGGGMGQQAERVVATAAKSGEATMLSAHLGSLTAKHVGDAAEAGDEIARRIISSTGERLGEALAILVDILNPECIVIGGLAVRFGDTLLEPARRVLHAEGLPGSARACRVLPAALGESIGDIAALCVAVGLESKGPLSRASTR
jgi:glucokinase